MMVVYEIVYIYNGMVMVYDIYLNVYMNSSRFVPKNNIRLCGVFVYIYNIYIYIIDSII